MQVSVETVGNLGRRMTINLPADRLQDQVGGRLREIARTARIKGFRPGKVPAKVIEQRFGQQVRSEVRDGLLREGFDGALRDNALRIAGQPKIEPAEGDDLAYVATFEVVPDFGDLDVSGLKVERAVAEVTEEDIDRMIENLRQQRRSWSAVNRPAKEGDAVDIETWSEVEDARLPAEGVERGVSVIGSGAMLPDIEQALVGMSTGDEKDIEVAFPAEWRVPELAGKTARVHLKAEQVSEAMLPEADAAFIRSFGVKSGEMEQFRSDIRTNLERELKGALMNRLRRAVGEQLVEAFASVELPPNLVEQEAHALVAQVAEQARRQGRPSQPPADAHQNFIEPARKRVLVGLLVGEVARKHQLVLDRKRLDETLRLIASTYEEPQQVIDLYRNDPQLMGGLQNRVMEEQVIDWIAERAEHTDQQLTFQEAIAPQA
ncbi:trigger factor [Luteimonas sp. MC1750]|uniref:trigger factor n=1 Tax=Luteimonas sp. MC1750 TaxID=2799326 RepID=UPI0018F0D707|nr:trigger factor [Luteimonas sp. MC1750]MBJ6983102.1 trigger factor [Luteimonas sp. MC1750]QQO05188.1 trigger factor [Luteimonas sp. MC1750]